MPLAASEITLVRKGNEWVEILLDGAPSRFHSKSHIFKLLAAMIEQADGKSEYIFDATKLADD